MSTSKQRIEAMRQVKQAAKNPQQSAARTTSSTSVERIGALRQIKQSAGLDVDHVTATAPTYAEDLARRRRQAAAQKAAAATLQSGSLAKNGYVSMADLNAQTNGNTTPATPLELSTSRWAVRDAEKKLDAGYAALLDLAQRRTVQPDGTPVFRNPDDSNRYAALLSQMQKTAAQYDTAAEAYDEIVRRYEKERDELDMAAQERKASLPQIQAYYAQRAEEDRQKLIALKNSEAAEHVGYRMLPEYQALKADQQRMEQAQKMVRWEMADAAAEQREKQAAAMTPGALTAQQIRELAPSLLPPEAISGSPQRQPEAMADAPAALQYGAYTAGKFGSGLYNGALGFVGGVRQAASDLLTGGRTSDAYEQIAQYLNKHETEAALVQQYGMELPQQIRQRLAEWIGVADVDLESYLISTEPRRLDQTVESGFGEGLNETYKKVAGQGAYQIGQMAPGILLSALLPAAGGGGGVIGGMIDAHKAGTGVAAALRTGAVDALKGNVATWMIGGTVFSSKLAQNAAEQGTDWKNYADAAANALAESFSEGLFGFSDAKSFQRVFATKTGSHAKTLLRNLGRYLLTGAEEGLEEMFVDPPEALSEKVFLDPDKKWFGEGGVFDAKQMLRDGAVGAAMGLLMGGVGAVLSTCESFAQEADIARAVKELNQEAAIMPEAYRPALRQADGQTQESVAAYAQEILRGYYQAAQDLDGQKNTASGTETGERLENMLTEADLEAYLATGARKHVRDTKQEQLAQGDSPILTTIGQVREFIRKALHGQVRETVKGYGRVSSRLRDDVLAATDGTVDLDGYYMELSANEIGHLSKHVETDADARNIPLTEEQALSLPEYIQNYDDLIEVNKKKNGTVRLLLGKKINGHSIIVETVSKGRSSLHPITAYQVPTQWYEQNYKPKAEAAYSASRTAETAQIPLSTSAPGTASIAQGQSGVKGEKRTGVVQPPNANAPRLTAETETAESTPVLFDSIPQSGENSNGAFLTAPAESDAGTAVDKTAENNDTETRNQEEAERDGETEVYLRDGGQRAGGADSGGSVSAVEGGAGQTSRRAVQRRPADGGTARLAYGEKVSTASLGIGGGSAKASIRLVTGGDTAATAAARKLAKERGLRLVLFAGDNLRIRQKDGSWTSVRGYISGDRVFVRVDHPYYTADQLMRHEAGHDRIAKGEVDVDAVRERIAAHYDPEAAAQLYIDAYAGSGMTEDEIWAEIICDSLGDMNIFADTVSEELAQTLLDEAKAAAVPTETNRTRGPPNVTDIDAEGKMSREIGYKKVGQQEWRQIQRERMSRYGAQFDHMPPVDAFHAHDMLFIIENFDEDSFGVIEAINPAKNQELANYVWEELKSGNIRDTAAYRRRVKNQWRKRRSNHGSPFPSGNTGAGGSNAGLYHGDREFGRTGRTDKAAGEGVRVEQIKDSGSVKDAKFSRELESVEQLREQNEALLEKVRVDTGKQYDGKDLSKDASVYTYDFLTSLPDMKATVLPEVDAVRDTNGRVDTAAVVSLGMKNARAVGTERDGKILVRNRYTGRRLQITVECIRHGLNGGLNRLLTNARLGAVIGDLVQNAVPINALQDKAKGVAGTYAMAGYAVDSAGREFVAIMTVEQRTGRVVDLGTYDMLHALSGRQKRSERVDTKSQGLYPSTNASAITIADFLEAVKRTHQSILPQDVLNHFGQERNPGGYYTNKAKFSQELENIEALRRESEALVRKARREGWSDERLRTARMEVADRWHKSLIMEYGAIPAGEKPAREVQVPRKTGDTEKVSQTVRTILEARATPESAIPSIQELVTRGEFSYETITDKEAVARAESTITGKNWGRAFADWKKAMSAGKVTKDNTALGWALYNNAANSGNLEMAMDILQEMVRSQRNAAQALQATRILKQLSPESQLYGVVQSVEGLQRDLNKRFGEKNAPELKIDEELGKKLLEAKTQAERDAALREIYRDIGRQMPSTFRDKWNAWRYLAMLGNVRTHVRNVVGNAGFAPIVATKNVIGAGIELAANKLSGGRAGRTKTVTVSRALYKAAKQDFANVQEEILAGGKYSDFAMMNDAIERGRQIFKLKPLEALRRLNGAALDAEDAWFCRPHYASALAQYCKANGITAEQIAKGEGLDAARAYAVREAQRATYRDTNAFSGFISNLRADESSKVGKAVNTMVVEGVLPFKKTPANILVRGVQYSPLGLIKSVTYDLRQVHRGEMAATELIDNLAAGLTGTGLLALGAFLAAQGLVRGGGDGDKDKEAFEDLMGHQSYALEVGGRSYTLDWLAPEALPFFVGVNLIEAINADGKELDMSAVLEAIGRVTEPMLEMSCLQGVNSLLESFNRYTSDMSGLATILASTTTSYLTQVFPTLAGQLERAMQPDRMSTYVDKTNRWLTGDMQYTIGKISAKLPGWDYGQIPYIDAWGRTETESRFVLRLANNLLNPAYTSKINESQMERELQRLYEATGEKSVLPDRAAQTISYTEGGSAVKKELSADEYVTFAVTQGQLQYKAVCGLVASGVYQTMADEDKVECVSKIYSVAKAYAKQQVSDYVPDGFAGKALVSGIDLSKFVVGYVAGSGMEGIQDADGETIPNSRSLRIMQAIYALPGYTDTERQALFAALGVGKKVCGYNKAKVEEELKKME